jgi:hypothetical protein
VKPSLPIKPYIPRFFQQSLPGGLSHLLHTFILRSSHSASMYLESALKKPSTRGKTKWCGPARGEPSGHWAYLPKEADKHRVNCPGDGPKLWTLAPPTPVMNLNLYVAQFLHLWRASCSHERKDSNVSASYDVMNSCRSINIVNCVSETRVR